MNNSLPGPQTFGVSVTQLPVNGSFEIVCVPGSSKIQKHKAFLLSNIKKVLLFSKTIIRCQFGSKK
jgi:hypothetical protein